MPFLSRFRTLAALGFFAILAPVSLVPAQNESAQVTPAVTPDQQNEAIMFLAKMEAKNADLKTLYGKFKQTRTNQMFLEEIKSTGEFWYSKPDQFRCDYYEPTDAVFYLLGDTALFYTPELKQVEKVKLDSGDQAPINQMLVGFGLSLEKITDVFNVRMLETEMDPERYASILFTSKDSARTLDFQEIKITFDRQEMQPKVLEMQEGDDLVVVTLEKVEKNKKIDSEKYKAEFPEDVEIIPYQ